MRETSNIQARAEELYGSKLKQVRLIYDTSEFMMLEPGDVVELEGRRFLLRGTESEGRFGLDDEPKYWVKRALDWKDGSSKILKLVFHEQFDLHIGHLKVHCYRSPLKEARILEMVRGHSQFMQGVTLYDTAGNPVRVLDRIRGGRLDEYLQTLPSIHQEYFQHHLREVLEKLVTVIQALGYLHNQGQRHGDVRRDHIFTDINSDTWRWIDFDYNFEMVESPYGLDLYGLGNILAYAVARGDVTVDDIIRDHPDLLDDFCVDDFSLIIKNRLMNLKKLYPYLPEQLNNVLRHFSAGSTVFYRRVEELMEDLGPALEELPDP